MSRLKRYDKSKRGSFQISINFFDWELSSVIGALRAFRKDKRGNKAYQSFLARLEDKFGEALGDVLKAEFRDLKVAETKSLEEVCGQKTEGST